MEQNKIEVKIKKVSSEAKIPIYGSEEAAGFDLYCLSEIVLLPGKVTKIPIGLAFEIPRGFCLQIWDRSGLALKGIHHVGGIIDSDYRGEIGLMFLNTTQNEFKFEKGDRIAQALLIPVFKADFKEVNELSETKRGSGGFHSTGRK